MCRISTVNHLNLPPQEKETLYKELAENRTMPRPSEEDYLKCQKLEEFLYWGFMRKCQEYIDFMREKVEFDTTEDKFLTGGMEEDLRNASKLSFETEKLMREYHSFQMIYQIAKNILSAGECKKQIEKLGLDEEEIIRTMKKLLGYLKS